MRLCWFGRERWSDWAAAAAAAPVTPPPQEAEERVQWLEIGPSAGDLRRRELSYFFNYEIFPRRVLDYRGEWQSAGRRLQPGDWIVQVARLPPMPGGLRLVFGSRIHAAWLESRRAGFSYLTLAGHPERGENRFELIDDGRILRAEVRTRAAGGMRLTRALESVVTLPYAHWASRQALAEIARRYRMANPT
jgi:hypothetical protein